MPFYFYHFVCRLFLMHFNSYLRVPMCLERNLNICAVKKNKPGTNNVDCSINTIKGLGAVVEQYVKYSL